MISEGTTTAVPIGAPAAFRSGSRRRAHQKVLLLSASTGGGHHSAAHALGKALTEEGMHARVVDALYVASRAFRTWYGGGYELLVRRWPAMWGRLYRSSDHRGLIYGFQTMLDVAFMAGLDALIEQEQPDWVICTHSLPQPRLARLQKSRRSFRVGVVVTDFYPHRMWLRGRPDHYFVPGAKTRDLLDRGRPGAAAITTVTGIPIDPVFSVPAHKRKARLQLRLDEHIPLVVVTSGSIGGGPVAQAVSALAGLPAACQVMVACGRNRKAYERVTQVIQALPAGCRVSVRCEGSLPQEEFALRLRAADLVVGKPGGLTLSECLASGAPQVIYTPFMIPGQEEGNAAFVAQIGAGVGAHDPTSLRQTVADLIASPTRLETMRTVALEAARPDASLAITRRLCDL